MRNQIIIIAGLLLVTNSIVMADINQGLVARYQLNGNALDSSGNGKNGTTHNTTNTADRFGNTNSALAFNGSNSYVTLPINSPIWLPQNDFTISTWVRFDSAPSPTLPDVVLNLSFAYWENQSECTGYNIHRNWSDGKAVFDLETASKNYTLMSTNALTTGEWYQIVGVRSGTSQLLYIDGQLAASALISAEPIQFYQASGYYNVEIGTLSNGLYPGAYDHKGPIDDVRIYNRALGYDEVQQLYNVPEPATIALLGLGVLALRKRRKPA